MKVWCLMFGHNELDQIFSSREDAQKVMEEENKDTLSGDYYYIEEIKVK